MLTRLPFAVHTAEADTILLSLAEKQLSASSSAGARAWNSLYAFRIARDDFRGAAQALWSRLQRLKSQGEKVNDPTSRESEEMRRCWLALINVLACVGEKEAWVFGEGPVEKIQGSLGGTIFERKERKVITLEDVRKGYQEELDRVEAVQMGRFAFGGSNVAVGGVEAMDVL